MSNILSILLIFIFVTSCSLHENSKFWSKEKITKEKQEIKKQSKQIFKKEEAFSLEFNPKLKINLFSKTKNKSFINNLDNNNGRIKFNGSFKNKSKFKFKKIKNFYEYDPKISFYKNDVIFFDNKGFVLRFDNNSNLIWKINNYSKSEKKQNPILFIANNEKVIIIADNISKYYALNIDTGKVLWSKKNTSPFNSEIKIHKDKFFIVDYENVLRAYTINEGKEIWNVKTNNSLIRSQKKLSIVIIDNKIFFNNSLGDISAVDIKSGKLIWQNPTQSSLVYGESFSLKTSTIIADNNNLYFSNNRNEFFSMDINSGIIKWKQKINSNLTPTLVDDYIFTISLEGYFIIVEKNSGNIIRITDILKNFKNKKRNKILPTGFIIANDSMYLSTDSGKLITVDIKNSKITSTIKIDKNKITRPSVLNQNLFIITDNSIIKLD